MEHRREKVRRRFQKENDFVQYNGQKHMHVRGTNTVQRRMKINRKYTRKVSEEYSRIIRCATKFPLFFYENATLL